MKSKLLLSFNVIKETSLEHVWNLYSILDLGEFKTARNRRFPQEGEIKFVAQFEVKLVFMIKNKITPVGHIYRFLTI